MGSGRRPSHIHVGGDGSRNLIFVTDTKLLLGVVDGHIDSHMSRQVANRVNRVISRDRAVTMAVDIQGDTILIDDRD